MGHPCVRVVRFIDRLNGAKWRHVKFGDWALEKIKTKRGALMGAWGLGLAIFLDDYLSALTVGLSMRKITDAFKVPREMLAYIVNTTAPPWCVISTDLNMDDFHWRGTRNIACSTRGTRAGNILENDPLRCIWLHQRADHSAFYFRNHSLVRQNGRANERAEKTGNLFGSGTTMTGVLDISAFKPARKSKVIYFVLPMLVALAATIYFDIDALKGVMIAVAFTFVYYLLVKLGTFQQLSETILPVSTAWSMHWLY